MTATDLTAAKGHQETDKLRGRAAGLLAVLCAAFFLDALDTSMVAVALPSIQGALDMSISSLQWVVSGYVLGFGGFLLLGGRAADLLGRRRVFIFGLVGFFVMSALGGVANNRPLRPADRVRGGATPHAARRHPRTGRTSRVGRGSASMTPRSVAPAPRAGLHQSSTAVRNAVTKAAIRSAPNGARLSARTVTRMSSPRVGT